MRPRGTRTWCARTRDEQDREQGDREGQPLSSAWRLVGVDAAQFAPAMVVVTRRRRAPCAPRRDPVYSAARRRGVPLDGAAVRAEDYHGAPMPISERRAGISSRRAISSMPQLFTTAVSRPPNAAVGLGQTNDAPPAALDPSDPAGRSAARRWWRGSRRIDVNDLARHPTGVALRSGSARRCIRSVTPSIAAGMPEARAAAGAKTSRLWKVAPRGARWKRRR